MIYHYGKSELTCKDKMSTVATSNDKTPFNAIIYIIKRKLNDILSLSSLLSLEVATEHILLNHSYSLEPMLVYCQNSAGSWGRNFVGNWFVTLYCKIIHYFV